MASETGLKLLEKKLRSFKREQGIDFTVVNGENISGSGLTRDQAEALFAAGADVITLGNHTFGKPQIASYLDDEAYILRPANFTGRAPGHGYLRVDLGAVSADNPFFTADKLLKTEEKATFTLVEFHAQATSEKLALAYYLDGRVSALWGTHTHVPTADMRVFKKGTGYVTDLGMTGPDESVLGVEPAQSMEFFLGGLPGRYRAAEGPCTAQGCIFTLNSDTGLCEKVERIEIK